MDSNAVSLHIKSSDATVALHRETVCRRVFSYFEQYFSQTSENKVVCLLDDEDFDELKFTAGKANRGLHLRIEDAPLRGLVPQYFWDVVRPYDPVSGKCRSPFDSLVYLHVSTCEADIGLTLTLAHELRHFFQYTMQRSAWAANLLLQHLPEPFNFDFTVWWDFPIEVDARRVVKAVAENLYGRDKVMQYVVERIASPVTEEDGKDWSFLLNLDTAAAYDLVQQTKPLVQKYKAQLKQVQQQPAWNQNKAFSTLNFDSNEWHP
jgi:hypothetical protein